MNVEEQPDVRPRPEIGATTTRETRVRVCITCGYAVDEGGLCSLNCEHDDNHTLGTTLTAIYKTTAVLLREEDEQGNVMRS